MLCTVLCGDDDGFGYNNFNSTGKTIHAWIFGRWPDGDTWTSGNVIYDGKLEIDSGPIVSSIVRYNTDRLRVRRTGGTTFLAWYTSIGSPELKSTIMIPGPVTEQRAVITPPGTSYVNFVGATTDAFENLSEGDDFLWVMWH